MRGVLEIVRVLYWEVREALCLQGRCVVVTQEGGGIGEGRMEDGVCLETTKKGH